MYAIFATVIFLQVLVLQGTSGLPEEGGVAGPKGPASLVPQGKGSAEFKGLTHPPPGTPEERDPGSQEPQKEKDLWGFKEFAGPPGPSGFPKGREAIGGSQEPQREKGSRGFKEFAGPPGPPGFPEERKAIGQRGPSSQEPQKEKDSWGFKEFAGPPGPPGFPEEREAIGQRGPSSQKPLREKDSWGFKEFPGPPGPPGTSDGIPDGKATEEQTGKPGPKGPQKQLRKLGKKIQ